MALITSSIGTSSRDYSTIQLWEDALGGAAGGAGNDALGECYDDSDFDENVVINDSTPASVKLSVVSTDRHTGTANTGVRILETSDGTGINLAVPSGFDLLYTAEWIEVDKNGRDGKGVSTGGSDAGDIPIIKNMIVHGADGGDSFKGLIEAESRDALVMNCIIYDNTRSTGSAVKGINVDGDRSNAGVFNCTVADIRNSGAGDGEGIKIASNNANSSCKNNIAMDTKTSDFDFPGTNPDSLNNMSEDATSNDGGGSGHVELVSFATQFVSTTGGSEDFHLVTGSDAKDAGLDLGAEGNGIEFDINGEDRTPVTTWDIGAHEFELPAVSTRTLFSGPIPQQVI